MRNFIATISDRSLFLSRKLNEFALQSLKSRLLNYLKMHGGIHNQQEVAFILGVARPSLARALSELIAEGKVTMSGKQVILPSLSLDYQRYGLPFHFSTRMEFNSNYDAVYLFLLPPLSAKMSS